MPMGCTVCCKHRIFTKIHINKTVCLWDVDVIVEWLHWCCQWLPTWHSTVEYRSHQIDCHSVCIVFCHSWSVCIGCVCTVCVCVVCPLLQVVATVCNAPPYGHRKGWVPRTPQVYFCTLKIAYLTWKLRGCRLDIGLRGSVLKHVGVWDRKWARCAVLKRSKPVCLSVCLIACRECTGCDADCWFWISTDLSRLVPRWQPHCHSGLVTLPSVGAFP